ncbi:MAG: polyphosphate kinase 1 [Raoultibacter sp.]
METKKDLETIADTPESKPLSTAKHAAIEKEIKKECAYMQNRELSWLTFNERVLAQGADETVPLLERLTFISIFSSNLQEFFMVRVGSLTDLSLLKKAVRDSKTNMTPNEQLSAIYARCHELYPIQESIFENVRKKLATQGIKNLHHLDLNEEQAAFLDTHLHNNVIPFLSPQIINSRHPFPHLENGALYVLVRLDDEVFDVKKDSKNTHKKEKNHAASGVTLGLIPLPKQCERVIELPGDNLQFILIEHALEMIAAQIFSMYTVKHTNVICVTRNADLDATEGTDEIDEDYREHMKRILKKRSRLAPVRLECENRLSPVMSEFLLNRLNLKEHQVFVTSVPLDMGYAWGLASRIKTRNLAAELTNEPFVPQWPSCLDRRRPILEQVTKKEVLLSYPYESMDAFVQLLREAAADPTVVSIKITLYRLASQSHLAEALIAAAENGKDVTALFELRARFDESNNIEWSQRFEEAGAHVIYGFRDYKVHSKICCITRQTDAGIQHITQLGTGNYNEKTAKLYTDLSFITTDEIIGRDTMEFFRNMALENASANYELLWVAPLQIKPLIIAGIEKQMLRAQAGEEAELFFKTNSITDKDIIEKVVEASQVGVKVTMLVRGISCLIPQIPGVTDNIRIFSIVGRLLEHSRIYGFGPHDSMRIYLSSADLMTRNMDKRIEIAWPVLNETLRRSILRYIDTALVDTAKLRELRSDKSYTPLGFFAETDADGNPKLFDSQEHFIQEAYARRLENAADEAQREANSTPDETRPPQEAKPEAFAKGQNRASMPQETTLSEAERQPLAGQPSQPQPDATQAAEAPVNTARNVSTPTTTTLSAASQKESVDTTPDKPADTRVDQEAQPPQSTEQPSTDAASAIPSASRPLPKQPPAPKPATKKNSLRDFFARLFGRKK